MPTHTPDPPSSSNTVGTVLHGAWHGIWTAATTNPTFATLMILFLAAVALRMYRFFRWLPLTAAERDPQRRFAGTDRAMIMHHAGGRCEHHDLLGSRCKTTDKLHADHVHPYSRGGSTTIGNGQALCARHNKAKTAIIPFEWQLRRLARHRAGYYPSGISGAVVRRSVTRINP